MNIRWAKIRSWHALRNEEPGFLLAYCGKRPTGPLVDDLPATEKTCERCLQLIVKYAEF